MEAVPQVTDIEVLGVPEYDLARVGDRDLKLSERARELIQAGIPESTAKVTARRWAEWLTFCERELRTPLPGTRESLAEFVAVMVETPTQRGTLPSPRSVEQAIAVVRSVHRDAGFPGQPDTTDALKVLRGYKRRTSKTRIRQAPPILMKDLRRMLAATSKWTTVGKRDRLVLVLGLAMAGRRSELCSLDLDEVAEVERGLEVYVRQSKTDKDAEGELVRIPRGVNPETDPVRVWRAWVDELDNFRREGETRMTGRLLRSIDQWGNLGEALSPRFVTDIVRGAAERAELRDAEMFSAHSLRSGFATTAADQDVPMSEIARHGRWSEKSPVVMGYVRAQRAWDDSPLQRFGF